MRYGLIEGSPSGLSDMWHSTNEPLAAALSTAVLAVMAAASLALVTRVFVRTVTNRPCSTRGGT